MLTLLNLRRSHVLCHAGCLCRSSGFLVNLTRDLPSVSFEGYTIAAKVAPLRLSPCNIESTRTIPVWPIKDRLVRLPTSFLFLFCVSRVRQSVCCFSLFVFVCRRHFPFPCFIGGNKGMKVQ
jgi:hypothetical protein